MSKFKVGDRVAAYMSDFEDSGEPYRMVGTVTSINDKGILTVEAEPDEVTQSFGFTDWQVHPKQCRKLVKPKRRSLTLRLSNDLGIQVVCKSGNFKDGETIEFIEVRKKK